MDDEKPDVIKIDGIKGSSYNEPVDSCYSLKK